MLSESFRRLAQRSSADLARMRERFAAHVSGHDAVELDGARGLVVYRSMGRPIWHARTVLLAKLNCDLKMFGWWWHGQTTWTGSGPFDDIVLAGDRESVPELRTDALPVATEDEAFALAELAGAIAGAHGVSFTRGGHDLSFWALYDATDAPVSARPPPRTNPTPVSPFRSVRPAAMPESAGRYSITEPPPKPPSVPPPKPPSIPPSAPQPSTPRPSAPQPSAREAFARIADLAIEAARHEQPDGVTQAIVVASVDPRDGRRIAVHVVALAKSGKLVAVDPPRDLIEAIAKVASDAAHAGTARWKRLVARIADDERGFSFEIEMR